MADGDTGTKQISSMNVLNDSRCELRNAFMGSIQVSLVPNDAMFASPCKDLAIRVNVLRARGLGSSAVRLSIFRLLDQTESIHVPWSRENSFGFKTAGQKKRKNMNPDTLL